VLFQRETESTLSTLTLALSAALVQAFALFQLLLLNNLSEHNDKQLSFQRAVYFFQIFFKKIVTFPILYGIIK